MTQMNESTRHKSHACRMQYTHQIGVAKVTFILHLNLIHRNYDIISTAMQCSVGGTKGFVQRRTKAGSY